MIVYSDRRRREDPRLRLARLIQDLESPAPDVGSLLIEAGVLEAGVVDAVWPDADGGNVSPLPRLLGQALVDLALAARGNAGHLASAHQRLATLAAKMTSNLIEVSEPEGFAFYSLYPETYAEAARRFLSGVRPAGVLVIGVRSIGTTLSAVVAAELLSRGVRTSRITVRPRGHPWDRRLVLAPDLQAKLAKAEHILIVDEGPGLSGTSFASVVEAAADVGLPEDRIHLFPSWDSDGSGLRSERARTIWPRVRRWTVPFEDVLLDSDRLAEAWGGGALRDLSGGLWRKAIFPTGSQEGWPSTQPQHERRKYRLERDDGTCLFLKFAGLGERGHRLLARAQTQAAAGLAPPVVGLHDGFLALGWTEGQPVTSTEVKALAFLGPYLTHLRAGQPQEAVRVDDMLDMTRVNVAEGLGHEAAGRLDWMEAQRNLVGTRGALAVDGRMLPHEFLLTSHGVLKADGVDHHDDHFWPGTQDIAWDLAGACVEFDLDRTRRRNLLEVFEALTGDRGARAVLPFHEVAYLAWRLGYTSLAAESLGSTDDGQRMARDRDRYAGLLRTTLERGGG